MQVGNKESGKLYLIPNTLGDMEINKVLPEFNIQIINSIFYYIVENVRTARRFLAKCRIKVKIDDLTFYVLNEHTNVTEYHELLNPLFRGEHMGIISEAGCPAIADPGAEIVRLAHEHEIEVVPLVGPTSIVLGLMASGFNGQSFSFNGYLPIQPEERIARIKRDEHRSRNEKQTQIYIETPYRNKHLFESFLSALNPETRLCIAVELNTDIEFIKTKKIREWKNKIPEINKKQAIFLIYAG